MHIYKPTGVCSREISFDLENGKIKNVSFVGGCSGNLQGISSLVEDMDVNEVIKKLKGIKCGNKSTSCPDQLSKAIEELQNK
ncbi:TIGR03905 family TSCPD domain-containing protein [Clostridium sp. MB40-C1]|uniref:TIGR03905 family TSCPD domain-containing protein n=1 Tax=Clostridium sp. MB40-C1 TaxID=3070996 RepID=UPI0027DFE40B|nr:TIGR03905 family TSCPD domain-containing protein [Clostridium sp. MB40-C1]WMJ81077.1 TIGR03905 family TSCPD domain-containing protein [Clostridium sp. MB40-C1]